MDSTHYRYGSSRFASDLEIRPYMKKSGIPLGYHNNRELFFNTDAPILMVSGSGSHKGTSVLTRLACIFQERKIILDPKGELTTQSIDTQYRHNIRHYVLNPYHKHDLPVHRTNPLSFLKAYSTTLKSDCDLIAEFLITSNGGENSFFSERGQQWLSCLMEFVVRRDGNINFISLNQLTNAIEGNPNIWGEAIAMAELSPHEHIKSIIAEMYNKQQNSEREFGAVAGEIYKSLNFMNDSNIRECVSGHDFDLSVICDTYQKANISLVIPAENMGALSGFMRVIIGVLALQKSRNPHTPKVLFILEECAQLGSFKFLSDYILPYGRGAGLQPFIVYQDLGQIKRFYGVNGCQTFLANSQIRIFLGGGVRDPETARYVSDCLGMQTLEYGETIKQEDARRKKLHAAHAMLDGQDPLQAMYDMRFEGYAEQHQSKQQRPLMTAGEVMQMPKDRMIIFTGETPPIYAQKFNFWERKELAGLYFPNPYHPPNDSVIVKGILGQRRKTVKTMIVPDYLRDYPQYQGGRLFRYIDGYLAPKGTSVLYKKGRGWIAFS